VDVEELPPKATKTEDSEADVSPDGVVRVSFLVRPGFSVDDPRGLDW
jgi:hypothetical protein